ncbi:cytochrome P450 2D17-like [Acanthaster planci]|uniref:Cytochrome P450 2D17-like n=1 Tax=Acanthaster planci TaxID=133434 RepID=A0A8B7YAQ8_ACAPL|nr:cytochrome P450 2D17-like [Acanthaster planci]
MADALAAVGYYIHLVWQFFTLRNVVLYSVLLMLVRYTYNRLTAKNLPPGPWGLPLIGANFRLGYKNPAQALLRISQQYGRIFSIRFGPQLVVVLNDVELAKEAFVKNAEVCSGRPHPTDIGFSLRKMPAQLIRSEGQDWKDLRSFTLKALRHFGVGTKEIENVIEEEAQQLCGALEKEIATGDGTVDPRRLLNMAVANIICSFTFGNRMEYSSPEFLKIVESIREVSADTSLTNLMQVWPLLILTPPYSAVRRGIMTFRRMAQKVIDQHKETYDANDMRDILDMMIAEVKKGKDAKIPVNETYLWMNIGELFGAGADTTINSLMWAVFEMTMRQDVQNKVRKEIHDVIGTHRPPRMSDRGSLTFTQAALMESFRLRHPGPTGSLHRTTAPMHIAGYTIPENTFVTSPQWSMHRDPREFKSPYEYDPDNFLNEEGHFTEPKGFMPFGVGPRVCIGESLARTELFVFFTTLMQRFKFELAPGQVIQDNGHGHFGATYTPKPFKVRLTSVPH